MKKLLILTLILIPFLIGCKNNSNKEPSEFEAWNSGELTVYYDKTLSPMLDTTFSLPEGIPDIKAKFVPVNSREGMALLLNGKARVVLQSRTF